MPLSESIVADRGKPWRLGSRGQMQCSPNVGPMMNVEHLSLRYEAGKGCESRKISVVQ